MAKRLLYNSSDPRNMGVIRKSPNQLGKKWRWVPEMEQVFYQRIVAHVNRKSWWHVPPLDPNAYKKRGKFLASSFAEAEFYGGPLDDPQRVAISKPLVGDEKRIARILGIPPQREGMTFKQIAAHDAKWSNAALRKGYDAILLMATVCFGQWKATGKIPRSLELNILAPSGIEAGAR